MSLKTFAQILIFVLVKQTMNFLSVHLELVTLMLDIQRGGEMTSQTQ